MIDQAAILLFGVSAVWLSQDKRPRVARFACICGLLSQPFWLYASWTAGQWGIFLSSVLYTIAWLRGIRTHWMRSKVRPQ